MSADAPAPKRIQRQRTKGWRMPEGSVYVGRPTKWGNPFVIDVRLQTVTSPEGSIVIACDSLADTRACAVVEFKAWVARNLAIGGADAQRLWVEPLRGKDLACFCPLDQPCHADVLLELANG